MKLSDHQFEFLKDLLLLLDFIINIKKYKVTGNELFRPQEMQDIRVAQGLSKAKVSNHLLKCAIDLNIFINGKLTYEKKDLEEIGVFWESLNSLNYWGGFWKFKDTPHFERNVK